jgi:hypothetical protein
MKHIIENVYERSVEKNDERRCGKTNTLIERRDTSVGKMINDFKIIETEDGFESR